MSSFPVRGALAALATTIACGVLASQAAGHARVFPSTVPKGSGNAYSLVVPNESEDADITEVTITAPEGFLIGGFRTAEGWERTTESEGDGHGGVTSSVTWRATDGAVPPGEAAWFDFTGRPDEGHTEPVTEYTFAVEQVYSDGEVATWDGAEDSESPAPVVEIAPPAGGDGTAAATASDDEEDDDGDGMGTIALIVAIVALLLGLAGLGRRGGRSLT